MNKAILQVITNYQTNNSSKEAWLNLREVYFSNNNHIKLEELFKGDVKFTLWMTRLTDLYAHKRS